LMDGLKKKSIFIKGIVIFILLSVGINVGILVWTTDKDTWLQMSQFRWQFIPILLALGALRWYLDAMSFVTMAKYGTEKSLSLQRATAIRLEGTLLASIVPFLVGTFSMHGYLLHKEKLKISESVAITFLRAVLPVFIFLFNIPILLFMDSDPNRNQLFSKFLEAVSLPVVVIIVFMVITLFYPHQIKKGASAFIRWWGRIKFMHVEKVISIEERLFLEIDQFSKIFWTYLRKKKYMLIQALLWILSAFVVDYILAIAIIWGFGFSPDFQHALILQFLMRPIIFFAITPGGAGIWDFTYLGFYSLFLPQSLIGVAVLLWRILMTYFPCMIGAAYLTRDFHRDQLLRESLLEKGVLPDDGTAKKNPSGSM